MNIIQSRSGVRHILEYISIVAAITVFLASTVIIIGWMFNIAILKSIHPDFVSIKANTAISFFLVGGAILLMHDSFSTRINLKTLHRLRFRVAIFFSVIVIIITVLVTIQFIFNIHIGIDELLFLDDPHAVDSYAPGRMAPNTAFGLLILSTAILLLSVKKNAFVLTSQLLALFVLLLSILPILGYIYQIRSLFAHILSTSMAVYTAILFLLASLSILLMRPDHGLLSIFSSSGTGGFFARRLMPVAILIPVVLIWLRVFIDTHSIPFLPSELSYFFILLIIVFVWFVWRIAYSLNRLDTERMQTEKQLQKSSDQLELILEHAGNGIFAVNHEGIIVMVNNSSLDMLGYSKEEFTGKKVHDLHMHHNKDGATYPIEDCAIYKSYTQGAPAIKDDEVFIRKDGSLIPVDYFSTPIFENDKLTGAVISFRDISERKKAEQEIHNKNEFIQTVLDNLPIGVALNKFDGGEATYMNKKFEDIYGWDKETIKDVMSFFEKVYPDQEYRKEIMEKIMADIQSGDPERMHWENIRITTKAGSERYINAFNIPLVDQNTMVSTVIDITKQKLYEREIKLLNEELEQKIEQRTQELMLANKELEAFTYSVSHDLRGPLRAIDGFTRILQEDYQDKLDDNAKRVTKVVRDNTHKMGQLIDDLLTFSRLSRMDIQRSEVDMGTLANSIYHELTSADQRDRVSFKVNPLPRAYGDPTMIRQVWVNLISNALKFSAPKEKPEINIFSTNKEGITTYTIRDNGVGFDMRYVDKIFGVFQRLHNARDFDGTGVGLAIVHRIIEKHGGKVSAESQLNEFALFNFSLPAHS
jgi:PAS domain S-box-containing protein